MKPPSDLRVPAGGR